MLQGTEDPTPTCIGVALIGLLSYSKRERVCEVGKVMLREGFREVQWMDMIKIHCIYI